MRKFNSGRLYKLVKVIVITITILSIFGIYIGYQGKQNMYSQFSYAVDSCKKMYPQASRNDIFGLNNCLDIAPKVALKGMKQSEDLMYFSLSIAILLPLFFFGGRLVYKYIFPIKSKNE